MRLMVQIPAHNEQESIADVLKSIPQKIKGVDEILILVINDGSCDDTSKIAKSFSVDVIDIKQKQGLSNAFRAGVLKALEKNCDILVNIDGDNQYCAQDIEKLILPVLDNEADIVVGARPIDEIKTFSKTKKILQKLGSKIVKLISSIKIKDAASGFRAYNKKALLSLNVFNDFTYTIETIIQAKYKNLTVKNVDISVNEQKNRKSKLFKNNFDYIFKQAKNLIRFFIIYSPCKFFASISLILFTLGLILGVRFLYLNFAHIGQGHVQSLILGAIIFTLSFICALLAVVGDLFSINRKILEDIQFEIRQNKYKK